VNVNATPVLDRRLVVILRRFVKELRLSAATYARIVILARRIADWAQAERVTTTHLLEAIQLCTLERTE
jgi:predicted ATPase with chaperone activity